MTMVFAGLALAACGEETPTSVGGALVPDGNLRTYELLLPADSFLVADSVLDGFGTLSRLGTLLVAQDFLGTLDIHALLRPGAYPATVAYTVGDSVRTDSMPRYIGGRLVLRVDTAGLGLDSLGTDTSMVFELYTLTEEWDARTATWTHRIAEPGDSLPWTQPGGTTGVLIDSATWVRGDSIVGDSIVFDVDSATIAAWSDASDPARGALLRSADAGTKARVSVVRLRLEARPSARPDTVVTTGVGTVEQTIVFDPPPPPPTGELRVGGRAGWRSVLTFRDSLFDMRLPCPPDVASCDLRLRDATINRAQLRLITNEVPAPYLPEFPLLVEARRILGPPDLPLTRAPVADTTGTTGVLTADTFAEGGDTLSIGVTSFIMNLASAPDSVPALRDRQLALLPAPEPGVFGYASFAGIDSPDLAPLLRLIVTVSMPEEDL